MTSRDDERIVRAAVAAPAQLPQDAISNLGEERTLTLLSATTAIAIHRKFPEKPDPAQVREFSNYLQSRFPDAADLIKPNVIDALVRFAFGQPETIAGVLPEDLRTALLVLPYAIVSENDITGESLDELVSDALMAVDVEE